MKMSEGLQEGEVVVGNAYDKYGSRNPIVKRIMQGFSASLSGLVARAAPRTIHEVGCGEGYWVMEWNRLGIAARGSDFSGKVIRLARENAERFNVSDDRFAVRSIYDLAPGVDSADLVVCCEVLEHLEDPAAGLSALQRITTQHVIISVPREPIWCALNLVRGKYIRRLGNTPGHIQHWSHRDFIELVSGYFDVLEIRAPVPWTMVLCRARQLTK